MSNTPSTSTAPPENKIITAFGSGQIHNVEDNYCDVMWEKISVRCSIMTYNGGDELRGAESLKQVLKCDDEVIFEAYGKSGDNTIRAARWHLKGFQVQPIPMIGDKKREVATQTVDISEYL